MNLVAEWQIILGPENFPNLFTHINLWVFLPLHIIPYPLRAFQFIINYHLAQLDEDSPPSIWKTLYEHYKFVNTYAFNIYFAIIMAISITWGAIRLILYPVNQWGHYGSGITDFYFIVVLCGFAICSILLWITAYVLKDTHEEIRINKELILINILWSIFAPIYIVVGMIQLKPEYNYLDIIPQYLIVFLTIYDFTITFCYPISIASIKPEEITFGIDVLDNFELFLNDPEGSRLFYNYTVHRNTRESYLFFKDVQNFRSITDVQELQKEYKKICEKYCEGKTILTLNMRKEKRESVLNATTVDPTIFDNLYKAYKIVVVKDVFYPFKITPEFEAFARAQKARILKKNVPIPN
ncbi:hypothetical protein TVAG_360180 [Trichomonas vaginalis G3]|uniref:RGS domain-containing protein n=1 Tax=Trichomonas vaginalis (strain ATCC PRA-98 / G3) TaxID=412133 RepID=A2DTD7_TRIV3|nr:positive regulation of GTPase protein [Trichomonas vaginalis G3]EAY16409.1 hypothetical protein TVAG_360180 [Trichomonas vaginalis G3]KAI5488363.1 positive regulation of GTPase protein [Trichomonas vaginalis G3]|eukprot:XP_001328632.1 hypothetical protein [Trichomonas vaginalis G3]